MIGNNGDASLACVEGGSYRFVHSTFANFWSGGVRVLPAVFVSNSNDSQQSQENQNQIQASFQNCIIEGNQGIEFLLEQEPDPNLISAFRIVYCASRTRVGFFRVIRSMILQMMNCIATTFTTGSLTLLILSRTTCASVLNPKP